MAKKQCLWNDVAWGFCEVGGWPGLGEGALEDAVLASAHVDSSFGCRGGWFCIALPPYLE